MYTARLEDGNYGLYKDQIPLETPMGTPVETASDELATRLVRDLNTYGEDPSSAASLVTFHYSLLDFFMKTPRAQLEANVALGLRPQHDWTMECPTATPEPMMRWWGLFGEPTVQMKNGTTWLSSLSAGQLCAVCVLGRAVESVNIPFILATKVRREDLERFAEAVGEFYTYLDAEMLERYFDNFLFYFGCFSKPKQTA